MPDSTNFAPRSFFFTDPGAITQTQTQAFGPVDENRFRTTAGFSVAADSPAYAVCTGTVLVQPQSADGSRVNLILRPFKQPIQGLNIRYFVYRGLDISGFFSNGNVLPATESTSDFVNSVNTAFADYYHRVSPGTALPEFKAAFIGYDPQQQPDNILLSDLFFKRSTINGEGTDTQEQSPFELPLAQQGSTLGNFKTGECGFEVVLSYGDYKLPEPNDEFRFDLAYARSAANTIDVSSKTDEFKKKRTREQITQFIDTAAYYGFHYREDGAVDVKNNTGKTTKKGEQIYSDVIINFYTRNNLYLYIQSDRGRSYNFYENYGINDTDDHSLLLGYTETTLIPSIYGTQNWPLIIHNAYQVHDNSVNRVYLQLVTDNNPNTKLYGQVGSIENSQGNNFCDANNLKIQGTSLDMANFLTKIVVLINPNTGPNGTKLNIATFNILHYQGVVYGYQQGGIIGTEGIANNVLSLLNFFDDVFDLINGVPLIKDGLSSLYSTLTNRKVKLVNHYYNDIQYGISAAQTTIIHDIINTGDSIIPTLNRVTYMTDSIDILNNPVEITGSISSDTQSSSSMSGEIFGDDGFQLSAPFYFDLVGFTDFTIPVNGLLLKTVDDSVPNKIVLGLTLIENELLKELLVSNSLFNPRIAFIDLFNDTSNLISSESLVYKKYQVGIIGESSSNELRLVLSEETITVYSIDKKCFFSKGYSEFIHLDPNTSLFLDLEISI